MTVFVPRRGSTKSERRYHTDPECQYIGEHHREWPREQAENWGYQHCSKCAMELVEA